MDTLAVELSEADDAVLARLVEQVVAGADAVLVDPTGSSSLLRDLVPKLEGDGCSVVICASTPEMSGLSALLAQVAGQGALDAQDDNTLERSFQRLTIPDQGRDRVVLVIDGADTLQDPVFRYVALACKATDKLRLVLAGRTDPTIRAGQAVPSLQARLAAHPPIYIRSTAVGPARPTLSAIDLASAAAEDAPGAGELPPPASSGAGRGQRAAWMVWLVGALLSAAVGFGLGWHVRSGYRTTSEVPETSARADPHGLGAPAPVTSAVQPAKPEPDSAAVPTAPAAVEPSSVSPPAVTSAMPAEPEPVPAGLLPPLPNRTSVPEPNASASPNDPEQTPAPPAEAPPRVLPGAVPARPALPSPRGGDTGQDRKPQAVPSSPGTRDAIPGAGRVRPFSGSRENQRPEEFRRPPGTSTQGGSPQGAAPPNTPPIIGSFVIGPDGTRMFKPVP